MIEHYDVGHFEHRLCKVYDIVWSHGLKSGIRLVVIVVVSCYAILFHLHLQNRMHFHSKRVID